MEIRFKTGNIIEERADVLICSANVELKMSGGVNGAILLAGGEDVQRELLEYRESVGRTWVQPGTVVVTSPGPTHFNSIVHAVAVDGMYDAAYKSVAKVIRAALDECDNLGAETVALTALATGYGRLTLEDFGRALWRAVNNRTNQTRQLIVVVRRPFEVDAIKIGYYEKSRNGE